MRRISLLIIIALAVTAIYFFYPQKEKNNSVVLIILDTLRADHLGFYGYERDTSPILDKFARENLAFKNAISTSNWTPPSVATMLTGLYPTSHTMMPPSERELSRKQAFRLPADLDTLPEILKDAGFNTGIITPNPWITPEFGFDQGFDQYHVHLRENAEFITREAKEMLENLSKDGKPFFAVIHYLDPHDPYRPPAPYSEMFTGKIPRDFEYNERMNRFMNQYDGEIRYMDFHIGDLFSWMKEKNIYDGTAILLIGDHGEQFMERGDFTHGLQLYNEEINVPLFLKTADGKANGVVEEVVSSLDVKPTLLEQAGVPLRHWVPGLSLTSTSAIQSRRGVMSEIDRKYFQRAFTDTTGKRIIMGTSVRDTPLEGDHTDNEIICFDSVKEPLAMAPLDDPEWCQELKELLIDSLKLAKSQQVGESQEAFTMQDDTLEQLRSLGYIQ
jgi:arylsulfatase A-like enzyme